MANLDKRHTPENKTISITALLACCNAHSELNCFHPKGIRRTPTSQGSKPDFSTKQYYGARSAAICIYYSIIHHAISSSLLTASRLFAEPKVHLGDKDIANDGRQLFPLLGYVTLAALRNCNLRA